MLFGVVAWVKWEMFCVENFARIGVVVLSCEGVFVDLFNILTFFR